MFLDLCCTIKYVKASEQANVTFDYQFVEDFGDTHPSGSDIHDLRYWGHDIQLLLQLIHTLCELY